VIHLDQKTWQQVAASVRSSLGVGDSALVRRLSEYETDMTLGAFLAAENLEPEVVYRNGRSWHALRRAAGRAVPPLAEGEGDALQGLEHLVHVDDPLRLRLLQTLCSGQVPDVEPERRSLAGLLALLLGERGGMARSANLPRLASYRALRAELSELVEVLEARSRVVPRPISPALGAEVPLALHARYQAMEILAALDHRSEAGNVYVPQTGVVPLGDRAEVLLVTLDKGSKAATPHLQYDDYAISPTLFHWESAATTRLDSKAGRRHLDDAVTHLMFVRERDEDDRGRSMAYRFLGAASPVDFEGERPIAVTFEMSDADMPVDLLVRSRAAVG
jgi:hypothetical protein